MVHGTNSAHERTQAEGTPLRLRVARWLGAGGAPVAGLVVLLLVLSLASPHFLTARNLVTVLLQATVLAMLALGQTFVILTGGIDLAVAAILGFSATVSVYLVMTAGLNPYLGLLMAVLLGVSIGALHGLLVTRWAIPPLIVTLGGLTLWRGLGLQITEGQATFNLPAPTIWLGEARWGPVPVAVIVTLGIYLLAHLMLHHTRLGRYLYAIGASEEAARRFIERVDRYKIAAYALSGLMAALGGIILTGRLNSVHGTMAAGGELDAIVAVVVGGTSLFGGEGGAWQTLLGALIITLIRNGLNLLGVSAFWQMVAIGIMIIGVVRVDIWRRRLTRQ